MGKLEDQRPALLLIDLQKGFEDIEYWGGERNNPQAEKNSAKILNAWREANLPLFHIKHCSLTKGSPLAESHQGNAFIKETAPVDNEPVFKKSVNSAFIGTGLKEELEKENIDAVVVVGLTTDHCISTSTRMAGNLGFKTTLISDATATFNKTGINGEVYSAEEIHLTALASLKDEFATIITTEELLSQL